MIDCFAHHKRRCSDPRGLQADIAVFGKDVTKDHFSRGMTRWKMGSQQNEKAGNQESWKVRIPSKKGVGVSGTPAHKNPSSSPVSVRARLRQKSQLTLPEEVRRALRVDEGDEVEFRVEGNGTITVRGYTSVPTDHAWLYAPYQEARRTPGQDADGRQSAHKSVDALFAYLDALGAAGP